VRVLLVFCLPRALYTFRERKEQQKKKKIKEKKKKERPKFFAHHSAAPLGVGVTGAGLVGATADVLLLLAVRGTPERGLP